MTFDFGARGAISESLDSFVAFAEQIGLNTLGVPGDALKTPYVKDKRGFVLLGRADIKAKKLPTVRKTADRLRRRHALVTIRLGKNVEIANWAAEDSRIDMMTLNQTTDSRLRSTTARLAAASGTALEIQFAPLLYTSGFERSRLLKVYRENVRIALGAEMRIVLSSGAERVLHLRSPMAMRHIGPLLGIEPSDAKNAVIENPRYIMERNLAKLGSDFIADGVSIVGEV